MEAATEDRGARFAHGSGQGRSGRLDGLEHLIVSAPQVNQDVHLAQVDDHLAEGLLLAVAEGLVAAGQVQNVL